MFTIESVTNLQWHDEAHTFFSCDVKYAEFGEVHPTGVNATDPYAHIQELWAKGNAGDYGLIAEYVAPKPDPEVGTVPPEQQPKTTGSQTL